MKKIIHSFTVVFLLTSMTSFVSAHSQESATQPDIVSISLDLFLSAPAILFKKVFITSEENPFWSPFKAGYTANIFRLSDFGENIFEYGAKKLGMNKKYAPWVGTASWNFFSIQTPYSDLQPILNPSIGKKVSLMGKAGAYFMMYSAYGLGALSGALWRKKVLAPTWERGIKPALFYAAHAARKTFKAAIA